MTAAPPLPTRVRTLPELELEVMKILWRLESATVADVHEDIYDRRPLAYTTVMTVLDRLARKQAVTRFKQGRGYVYRPLLSREYAREAAVDRLLNDFFSSSPRELASYLSQTHLSNGTNGHANGSMDSSLL